AESALEMVFMLTAMRRVLLDGLVDVTEDGREVPLPREDEERELRVTPRRIPEELIEGVTHRLRTVVKLGLGDEDRTPFDDDHDVGLSCRSECLACRVSFELTVELHQERIAEICLRELRERRRALFHDFGHVRDDLE